LFPRLVLGLVGVEFGHDVATGPISRISRYSGQGFGRVWSV
jgi:hypothetical protein